MKINDVILSFLIGLFIYLLIINLIRYNTVVEGAVTLDSSDIESIYTNKQKLTNLTTQQTNIENEIAEISKKIKKIYPTYQNVNRNMIAVTKKAEKEMAKSEEGSRPGK